MLDFNEFMFFENGEIEIGIDYSMADDIFSSLKTTKIKKEHIAASTPKKVIKYDQFYIQKKLVTVKQFEKFIIETAYVTESEKEGWGWVWNNKWIKKENVSWRNPFRNDSDKCYIRDSDIFPVMQISWNDSVAYTKWLSGVTGQNIRLPFEYEWEILGNYAGLNSIADIYVENKVLINTDKDFISILYENIKVSEFQLGLLWEWSLDWYNGYDKSILNKDFGDIYKILRGGSLLSEKIQKSKEFRFRRCPTARSPYYGFRIVFDN